MDLRFIEETDVFYKAFLKYRCDRRTEHAGFRISKLIRLRRWTRCGLTVNSRPNNS